MALLAEEGFVSKPIVSAVLSVLNERANLPAVHEALCRLALEEPGFDWEFVFVDDGSTDGTLDVLRGLAAADRRVKVLSFSRNFGAHEASAAGIRACSGDAAILMGADMEDPPEVIREFLRAWQAGSDVVFGVRASRQDAGWRQMGAKLFTAVIRRFALPAFPERGTGGFCLMSRRVIDAYNAISDQNTLTPGLLVWLGFPHAQVEYQRARRLTGRSKFGLGRLIKTAFDTLLSFSTAPAWWILLTGIVLFLAGGTVAGAVVVGLVSGLIAPGWGTVAVPLMLLLSGVHLIAMGVLGQYLWRILEGVHGRPQYVVQERIGAFSHASDRERRVA